jgi:hypothetical protein
VLDPPRVPIDQLGVDELDLVHVLVRQLGLSDDGEVDVGGQVEVANRE